MDIIDGDEFKALVGSAIENVNNAAPRGYGLVDGNIKFNVEISTEKTAEGGIKAVIFSAGGKQSNANKTTISFEYAKKINDAKEFTVKDKLVHRS